MHRKVHTFFAILVITTFSCSLPVSTQKPLPTTAPTIENAPAPTVSTPSPTINGKWSGTLSETGGDQRVYDISMDIKATESGTFSGAFTLVTVGETYAIDGTFDGSTLRFSEKNGRHFWSTFKGDEISGYVAWDCFDCDSWGTFSVTRAGSTPLPTPTTESTPQAASSPNLVRFANLTDGATLPINGINAAHLPTVQTSIDITGATLVLGLEADGLQVAISDISSFNGNGQATLEWNPWHGNGVYKLKIEALDWTNHQVVDSQTISVKVTGIPDGTVTVQQRFTQLYQEAYSINVPYPPIARYSQLFADAVDHSRWMSAVYVQNRMYSIGLYDDGNYDTLWWKVNDDIDNSLCRPTGQIRMLAVIVNYNNTGLTYEQATNALLRGQDEANAHWADYSHRIRLSEPILKVETTTAYVPAPTTPGQKISAADIFSQTGYRTTDFDIVTEIDLDANNTVAGEAGGLGVAYYGGCRPGGARAVNMAFSATDQGSLENSMPGSIYEHELTHNLGWMHWWPNGDSGNQAWLDFRDYWLPSTLFGWTDTDGDGVIEILDSTPYGMGL